MSKKEKSFNANQIHEELKKQLGNPAYKELMKIIEQNAKLNQTLRKTFAPYGAWVCPKCGAVYGPGVTECCRCNPPIKYEIIC